MHKAVIGAFCFAKGLDDLDAADIFHSCIVERFCRCDRTLIKLRAPGHHKDIAEQSKRHACQLLRTAFSDLTQYRKRCLMTCACAQGMKQYAPQLKEPQ